MKNKWPTDTRAARIAAAMKRLPPVVGRLMVNHYQDNFRAQGFVDSVVEPWQPRARPDRQEARLGRRALLVKTGALRRSLRILAYTRTTVTVGSTWPYAAIHNYGGTVRTGGRDYMVIGGRAVWLRRDTAARRRRTGQYVKTSKGAMIKIPARPFVGRSYQLDLKIVAKVRQVLAAAVAGVK